MLNQIVQALVNSKRASAGGSIVVEFSRPIGLYLDMFSDGTTLDNFMFAHVLDVDSNESTKYA